MTRRRNPKASTAVMAARAPEIVEADDPQRALWRKLDYYPTPPWAARAGAELIRALDPAARTVWEPACGEGHMAEPLGAYFDQVFASDLHPHGFGEVRDFLLPEHGRADDRRADWIMTNPPFKLASEFLQEGLRRADRGVALLVRLAFLESEDRQALLYGDQPVTVVAPFTERVAMQLGSWDPQLSTATAYAWFVWCKPAVGLNQPPGYLQPIPAGTKKRLTRPHDVRRFAALKPAPLFDGGLA